MSILSANTKIWLHGLFAAFISTFASSAGGFLMLPTVFNFTHNGLINMAKVSALPAMIAVFGYLKASPLPTLIEPGDTATVQNPTIDTAAGTITGTSATLKKAPPQS